MRVSLEPDANLSSLSHSKTTSHCERRRALCARLLTLAVCWTPSKILRMGEKPATSLLTDDQVVLLIWNEQAGAD